MRELRALLLTGLLATLLAACATAPSPGNRQVFQNDIEAMRPAIFQ